MAEQNQLEEVKEGEEIQAVSPTQTARTAIEEEIANRVNENVLKDNAEVNPEEPVAEAEPTEPPAETQEKPETVKIKIEGQEFDVPKDRVDAEGGVEAFQKKAAADLIFRRAKERENQANQLLAAARQYQPQQPVTPVDNKLSEAIEKLRFEQNPEEAARAVRELVGANQLTPEQINQIADQRYAHRRAVEKFQEKFPDILGDPILHGVAASMENHALAQGRRDFDKLFDEIGRSLTEWRGKLSGNFKDKQDKKSTITNIPQAKSRANAPETPKEPTVAEIIAQERRARKQA